MCYVPTPNFEFVWPIHGKSKATAKDVMTGAIKTQKLLEKYGPWDD